MNATFKITGPNGQAHRLLISVELGSGEIAVQVAYESGDLLIPKGTLVADWRADFEPPLKDIDEGQLEVGQGRLEILIPDLRGIGLGSYLMSIIISWTRELPNVPVSPIFLSADEARSPGASQRRNRFWEKLGFRFEYKDGGTWGQSKHMLSHDLIDPGPHLAKGWKIEEL